MRVLALIPARGGSKGVPRKNIRPVGGKPLIAHTIGAALASARIADVVTTTDDDEIAATAEAFGSEVLRRPAELADDDAPMVPVALHALDSLRAAGRDYDAVILLQCTCPFRTAADIDGALALLEQRPCNAVIGVEQVWDDHPARMYELVAGFLAPFVTEWETANRQDLPAVYHRNGVIYAIRCEALVRERTFFPSHSLPFAMPKERSVNIDDEFDLRIADLLMSHGVSAHS